MKWSLEKKSVLYELKRKGEWEIKQFKDAKWSTKGDRNGS